MKPEDHINYEMSHLNELFMTKLMEQVASLDLRLSDMEEGGKVQARGTVGLESLRRDVQSLKNQFNSVNERSANMRLDRQVKIAAKRLFGIEKSSAQLLKLEKAKEKKAQKQRDEAARLILKQMTVKAPVAIICSAYPGGARDYGGEFVQRRAEAYQAAGLNPVVIEVANSTKVVKRHVVDRVDVLRINPAGLGKVMGLANIRKIAVHSVEKPVWSVIRSYLDKIPAIIWVHGFEARDWRELSFNFSEDDLKTLRPRLDQANKDRKETMGEVFTHPNVQVIFVSNYMKDVAEKFAAKQALRSHVIHNSVSSSDFPYRIKSAEARKHILWVRTFAAKNYANDISRDVILGLSQKPYFKDLSFSIYGAGRYFDEITKPLAGFDNVSITNKFLSRKELQSQHAAHGVKLVPTRWDSQGLTCGEAMHSGLVPLTSYVSGLREFVDKDCAILGNFDDAQSLIDGYDKLYNNPELYLRMSAAAADRSAKQCNQNHTLAKEIKLLKAS